MCVGYKLFQVCGLRAASNTLERCLHAQLSPSVSRWGPPSILWFPMKSPETVGQPAASGSNNRKGKSCKGCLYYSSVLKSDSKNPRCVGVSRTLKQVPSHLIGESEVENTKKGRHLADFRYVCVGYSVFLENKENSAEQAVKQAELPFCVGVELLVDRRTSDDAPAHAHSREDSQIFSQPKSYKPPHPMGEEFLNRFTRNASLVAGGVARNLQKVGNYMKDSLDDILYPYRRRPK